MNAKQMGEKRSALNEQMNGLLSAAQAEGRNLTTEEKVQFDAMYAEQKELRNDVKRIEQAEELKKELASKADEVRDNTTPAKVEARDAFNAYLRRGVNGLTPAEANALGELRTGAERAGDHQRRFGRLPCTGKLERLCKRYRVI